MRIFGFAFFLGAPRPTQIVTHVLFGTDCRVSDGSENRRHQTQVRDVV